MTARRRLTIVLGITISLGCVSTLSLAGQLHTAAENGDLEAVQAALGSGADVNERDARGLTALHLACAHKQLEKLLACAALLDAGADVNAKGGEGSGGYAPLHDAAQENNQFVANLLLIAGAEVDARSTDGYTPLFLASNNGHETIVRLLLASRAEVDTRPNGGSTPLFVASSAGHETIVRLLIEAGADLNPRGSSEVTALHLAAYRGYRGIVDLLISSGADTGVEDEGGLTPHAYAVDAVQADIARMFEPAQGTSEVRPSATAKRVQELLAQFGLEPDSASGVIAQRTRDAVVAFQRQMTLPQTGFVNDRLIDQLVVAIDPSANCGRELVVTESGLVGYVKGCDPGHPRFYDTDGFRICEDATTSDECFRRSR